MSMHFYPQHGFGMFLNTDEETDFERAWVKDPRNWRNPGNVPTSDDDILFAMGDVPSNLGATSLNDDDCDARHVEHLDGEEHEEDGDDFVNGLFLYASKQGDIICRNEDHEENSTYADLDAMANEFRTRYGNWLPDNFDYKSHLAEMYCTYYC